jgi:hypothetical protein
MSEVVIITGMHRSGTSLAASLLQRAGIHLGERLVPPAPGNPYGHFEDVDFYEFHTTVLRRLEQGIFVRAPVSQDALRRSEVEKARTLIDQRRHRALWGWKDPRTALFLDFWHTMLPRARFVFIYRHPLEVVLSLLRRGSDLEALVDPLVGLRAWGVYNAAILDFYERHRDACLLCPIAGIVQDIAQFIDIVEKKVGLQLQKHALQDLYDEKILRRIPFDNEFNSFLKEVDHECLVLYEKICRRSDVPWVSDAQGGSLHGEWTKFVRDLIEKVLHREDIPQEVSARTLCMSLLALLDPETMASLPIRTQTVIEAWRQKEIWIESQLEAQQSWITELEAGKAWLEEQRRQWQAVATARQQQLEAQQSWITELEAGKAWLEEQRRQWQAQRARWQAEAVEWHKQPWVRLGAGLGVLRPFTLDQPEMEQGEH